MEIELNCLTIEMLGKYYHNLSGKIFDKLMCVQKVIEGVLKQPYFEQEVLKHSNYKCTSKEKLIKACEDYLKFEVSRRLKNGNVN